MRRSDPTAWTISSVKSGHLTSVICGQPTSVLTVQAMFGAFTKDIARGLHIRCDWGPQYIATAWIQEVHWLGMTICPSFVGEPQCNGVAERFMRTLKEHCLYLHQFESLEQARHVIAEFIHRDNHQWLIERLDHRTPVQARLAVHQPEAA